MIIKALIAGALVTLGTAAQAVAVHPELGNIIVGNQIVHPEPFTTPPPSAPTSTPVPSVVTSVPEPAAWMLMIAGFGIVGLIRRARVRTLTA